MSIPKTRLDVYLTEKNLCENRTKAQALIMAGAVYVDGQRQDKAGYLITKPDSVIELKTKACPYVSRGGLKLEKAINEFKLDLSGKVCIDIGASTGGFTDCMLQCGANLVYAIDVGYGQLDYRLRSDSRVKVFEKTNFRYISNEILGITDESAQPVFGCVDVSFISLGKIFPAAACVMAKDAQLTALIKPQFEAGKGLIPKSGVVADKAIHKKAVEDCIQYAAKNGFTCMGITWSPIKGGKGNIEYLALFERIKDPAYTNTLETDFIAGIVDNAHSALD